MFWCLSLCAPVSSYKDTSPYTSHIGLAPTLMTPVNLITSLKVLSPIQSHSEVLRVMLQYMNSRGTQVSHNTILLLFKLCNPAISVALYGRDMGALILIISAGLLFTGSVSLDLSRIWAHRTGHCVPGAGMPCFLAKGEWGAYLFYFLDHSSTFSFQTLQCLQ